MGDQTSLVSRQEREANAKNQPMFRKRLFKDILIAISGSFRTGTSNTGCCMMSSPQLPSTLTMGKLRKRARPNIPEDNVLMTCDTHRWLTGACATSVYVNAAETDKFLLCFVVFFVSSCVFCFVCFFLTKHVDINANVI